MLLAVLSPGKQNLILEFPWPKKHNLEVNQEKEKVKMMCCPPRYNSCKDLQRRRIVEEHTIAACQSGPFPQILEENEELDIKIECERLGRKLGDNMFLIYIFLEKFSANI